MKSKRGAYTPKEAAQDIAIGWLSAAHKGHTADLEEYDDRPSFQVELKKQIAKLHNRLLENSRMDGTHLEV